MEMYQHDSAATFQFVLRGDLDNDQIQELEYAWSTAKSILKDKELVVDVSGITDVDEFGVELLTRMRDSGARLTAALPPKSEGVLRSLGLPVAAPRGLSRSAKALRLFRLAGVRNRLAELLGF